MLRLVVFARSPAAGPVKTRLAATIGRERALALHRAFVLDQSDFALSLAPHGIEAELCLDAEWPDPEALPRRLPRTRQGDGGLGERMARALRRARKEGCRVGAILGADAPTLPESVVLEAFEAVETGADAAIAPAPDGGYVLVATGEPPEPLFRGISWGTPEVLEESRARAASAGLRLVELEPSFDVDVESDLATLREALRGDPRRARRTAALLGIRG